MLAVYYNIKSDVKANKTASGNQIITHDVNIYFSFYVSYLTLVRCVYDWLS